MAVGLVVAGGFSMRFGIAEKALFEIDGEPMLAHVVSALERTVDDVVIDCRTEQVASFRSALAGSDTVESTPTFAVDDEPDAGPIAGLANGLSTIDSSGLVPMGQDAGECNDPTVVVVSCDRPGVTSALLDHLCDRRRRCDVDAALPAVEGFLQPLCGAYRYGALAESVQTARDSGTRRLLTIPRSLDRRTVTERELAAVVDPAAIASVDTPFDAAVQSPTNVRSNRSPAVSGDATTRPSQSVAGD